jgi:hypothetical protein
MQKIVRRIDAREGNHLAILFSDEEFLLECVHEKITSPESGSRQPGKSLAPGPVIKLEASRQVRTGTKPANLNRARAAFNGSGRILHAPIQYISHACTDRITPTMRDGGTPADLNPRRLQDEP